MKKAELQQIIRWKDSNRLYEVVSHSNGERVIGLRSLDKNTCPHCLKPLDHDFMDIVESSPLFQENALPVKTISEPEK